jgi:hypothetical protein
VLEGKPSPTTTFRIQALESLGLEWEPSISRTQGVLKEPSLDENAVRVRKEPPERMQKIAAVEKSTAIKSKSPSSSSRVDRQKRRRVGATDAQFDETDLGASPSESAATASLYSDSQAAESLSPDKSAKPSLRCRCWENRLSELADYRKINGHCNVPNKYSENTKLGAWVGTQRTQYKLHAEGKTSSMTLPRIQELERLGIEWRVCVTAWEDRLSELAEYRKIHGHCNVPRNEIPMLNKWAGRQRNQYKLYREGKISSITPLRIQTLEILDFEWDYSGPSGKTV